MKVLKFGGTSVGTVDSLRNVKSIVESATEPIIVVVSALGGITDKLILTARQAADASEDYHESYAAIIERHRDVIDGIVPQHRREEVLAAIMPLIEELGQLYLGLSLIKELSDRTLDTIVSYGERMSSVIVTAIIEGAVRRDSLEFIRTTDQWGRHILDDNATQPLIASAFNPLPADITIVPGFISKDSHGHITNLGRGGSDYTAAILAAALGADVLEIWTDVDGFMTADPRMIKDARVIDRLSFTEAMELCNFGAKVIYPPTIYPVFNRSIPIVIKNTFNPQAPGTWISDREDCCPRPSVDMPFKGVSSIPDTTLVQITGKEGAEHLPGMMSRTLNAFAAAGISVFSSSRTPGRGRLSLAVHLKDTARALDSLNEEFAPELASGRIMPIAILHDMSTVAIVGRNMKTATPLASSLVSSMADEHISISGYSQGASDTTLSFVVPRQNLHQAIQIAHDCCFNMEP